MQIYGLYNLYCLGMISDSQGQNDVLRINSLCDIKFISELSILLRIFTFFKIFKYGIRFTSK